MSKMISLNLIYLYVLFGWMGRTSEVSHYTYSTVQPYSSPSPRPLRHSSVTLRQSAGSFGYYQHYVSLGLQSPMAMKSANALQGGKGLLVWHIFLLPQGQLTSEQMPEYRSLQKHCILRMLKIFMKALYLQHPLLHQMFGSGEGLV